MKTIYLLGMKTASFSEKSQMEDFARRKIANNQYAIQIWSSYELIIAFKTSLPNNHKYSAVKVDKEHFTIVMKAKYDEVKVELDPLPLNVRN